MLMANSWAETLTDVPRFVTWISDTAASEARVVREAASKGREWQLTRIRWQAGSDGSQIRRDRFRV